MDDADGIRKNKSYWIASSLVPLFVVDMLLGALDSMTMQHCNQFHSYKGSYLICFHTF